MGDSMKYNLETVKKIIHDVVEEEKKKYNLDVDFYPVTPIEFYTEHIVKLLKSKQSISSKYYLVTLPIYASGVNINEDELDENNIFLFLKRSRTIKKDDRNLYTLLHTCYHELWHSVQTGFDEYSYEGFLDGIDNCLKNMLFSDYLTEHPKYSFEIGANLYAATMAKEYLLKHYPEIYEKEKDYIEQKEKQAKFYYQTYDLSYNIELMINTIKKKVNGKKVSNLDKVSPILPIFLNDDISFKKVSEIISNEKFKSLDRRIIYAFFSNNIFLESIDFEKLSSEELAIVQESLQYTSILYQNQFKVLDNEIDVNLIDFLKVEKNILRRFSHTCIYIEKVLKHEFNSKRNDEEKLSHMDSISGYLERTNELIKKRSRGYITINIFYIVGFILSVLTFGYLLIK